MAETITQLRSVLIFCKNSKDKAVLRHLTHLLNDKKTSFITVHSGFGGSVDDLIVEAKRRAGSIAYDNLLLVVEGLGKDEAESLKRKHEGWEIIVMQPCVEGMLLRILEPEKQWELSTPTECVEYFEHTYMSPSERMVDGAYTKYFDKDKVARVKDIIPELCELIPYIAPNS